MRPGRAVAARSGQEIRHSADPARLPASPASLVAGGGGECALSSIPSRRSSATSTGCIIFQNQNFVTKQNLRGMTEKWAEQHGVTLPFVVDPSGELAAKVEADRALGNHIPLDHTPTIYIVTECRNGAPVTEVKDMNQLYQMLDEVTKQADHHSRRRSSRRVRA